MSELASCRIQSLPFRDRRRGRAVRPNRVEIVGNQQTVLAEWFPLSIVGSFVYPQARLSG